MASQGQTRRRLRERFYRGVAETLALLHGAPGLDRRLVLTRAAETLSSILGLPLVSIGRNEPGGTRVDVYAAAGPAAEYAQALQLSVAADGAGGQGPMAIAVRESRVRMPALDAAEFASWHASAQQCGFTWYIRASATTNAGGYLTLSAYTYHAAWSSGGEVLEWTQRLVDEMARLWDHDILLEHDARVRRYRDAQRTIQRALLEQPDPPAVYRTLARALVEVAGAAAVDVWVTDGTNPMLRRVALVGPMADAVGGLPSPPRHDDGPLVYTPTLSLMRGAPVIRVQPSRHPEMDVGWRAPALAEIGVIGCWPLFVEPRSEADPRTPVGVFVVVAYEPDAFDAEMCNLLDEIADATGLALKQHEQRRTLAQEQARQTYLALHDDLTHLPNRRALDRHLERVLDRAQRQDQMVAVGMLDLDDLKLLNDRYGHAVGDRVLAELAARVRSALRAEDYVARLGGDEFVLVFENLDSVGDLHPLLERVCHALERPALIEDVAHEVSASLGVALFPLHAQASATQLLRRADQAMYSVKARKRTRASWWTLAPGETPGELFEGEETRELKPYGPSAVTLLKPHFRQWVAELPALVKRFHAEMAVDNGLAGILGTLSPAAVCTACRRMERHLRALLNPRLELVRQRDSASRSGVFNAAWGLEEVLLLESVEHLRDLLSMTLGASVHDDRRPLGIVLQRLALERQWQLESMRGLQRRRVALLGRLNVLAWSADSYLELIQGVVDILLTHEEIAACAVGRPGLGGELTFEAVAGQGFTDFLCLVAHGAALSIRVDQDDAQGGSPSARAWHTGTIQRCANYDTDPAVAAWRDVTHDLGVASSVTVPLCPQPLMPVAILAIYSAYVGGFQSEDQQAFVDQIKTVLDLALLRLAPPRPGAALLPFFVRERWRQLVVAGAVQIHYQPLVRLLDGVVTGLEALARLPDEDGTLLLPSTFLPALGEGELVALFKQALMQAMACRQRLTAVGFALDVSVNVPAAALEDVLYQEAAAAALLAGNAVPGTLLLEILESPVGVEHSVAQATAGMQALKALGFRLVEDDLGAGYSSLIRLRQWPFDRVKIDQAIILQVMDDPLRTLRFIRQLIRLGHGLGLEVVVEGLETQGMIEAALILGADMGQGYALARPMGAELLPGWLGDFRPRWDATQPATALGMLAEALVWEERFVALPPDPVFWQRHATFGRIADDAGSSTDQALEAQRSVMHAASARGPLGAAYRQSRERYFNTLVERALAEERRLGDDRA